MGITALKIVSWGGKSSVIWSQIVTNKTKFPIHKTDDLPPQMTILNKLSPNSLIFLVPVKPSGVIFSFFPKKKHCSDFAFNTC